MIFVTGDTHASYDISKLSSKNFTLGRHLNKYDYVIVLGDFGLVWDNSSEERYWIKWLSDKPWTTLFIDGNHENHEKIRALTSTKMFGSYVGKVNDSIYHLKRGYIYTIEDLKILTIGGAASVDKAHRIENVTWWADELLSGKDINNALDNLAANDHKVDYILTHTCSQSIFPFLKLGPWKSGDPTMKELEGITNGVSYKHWFFGHFHIDGQLSNRHTCVYNKIIEIGV